MNKLFTRKRLFLLIAAWFLFLFLPAWPAFAAGDTGITYLVNGAMLTEPEFVPDDDVKMIEPYDGYFTKFTDYPHGYSLLYPAQMKPDVSEGSVRTVFSDETTRIEVYSDDFNGTNSSASDYVHYGNRQIASHPNHSIALDTWSEVNGYQTHLLEWSRPKLTRLNNDKNYYVSAEIIKSEAEVYTVLIKSSQPITNPMEIIGSFRLLEKHGTARNYLNIRPSKTKLNAETAAFQQRYFAPHSQLTWGVFEPSAPETMNYLAALENKVEYRFPFLLRYQGIGESLPLRGLEKAYQANRYVELTLQTVYEEEANALIHPGQASPAVLYDLLDGKYDEYLTTYAERLRDFGHPVLFRLNNEMNGDWCWYSAYYTGKDTEIYKAAWRYIHDIFETNGVENILWVWNPHDVSRPDFKWNHYLMYYPGDEYVDIIGLTGYNTGTYFPGEHWREFSEIYPALYAEYTASFAKPFLITEFGSNSVGGDKPAWIHAMFDQIKRFPNIKVAIWWNGIDYDQQGNPGRIYLLDESNQTIEAFRQRLQEYNSPVKIVPRILSGKRFMIRYPEIENLPAAQGFNQAVRQEAEAFVREFEKPELTGSLDYRVELNRNGWSSVTLQRFCYFQGAAHPLTAWTSLTVNTPTGQIYQLKDLFKPGAPFATEINKHIARQLSERQITLLRPFQGINASQEFYLAPDGIVIYYQLYDYTPYVYGRLAFTIPYEELKPWLKDDVLRLLNE
jgi:hypothetical protein